MQRKYFIGQYAIEQVQISMYVYIAFAIEGLNGYFTMSVNAYQAWQSNNGSCNKLENIATHPQ